MRTASRVTVVGSMLLCAVGAAQSCGGDDTSPGPAAATSTGAAGAASSSSSAASSTSSTAGGTAGSSGSTTTGSTTGAGGSGADAGGCPATQPAAGVACDIDEECAYGSTVCSCVASEWTCHAMPDGGGACPSNDDQPAPGDPCTNEGLSCAYPGNLICDCVAGEWTCRI